MSENTYVKKSSYKNKLKENLDALSKADHYLRFQFDHIKPFIGKRILEIGAGVGNVSKQLLCLPHEEIILVEKEACFVRQLENVFGSKVTVLNINLKSIKNHTTYFASRNIDTIIAINVVEHIKDDLTCLRALSTILKGGGRIILIVPAFNYLFTKLDKNYGHFRRYTKSTLNDYANQLHLTLMKNVYLDIFGWFGWMTFAKILRFNYIPNSSIAVFNHLTPVFKKIENMSPHIPFGLSLLGVFQK